MPKAIGKCVCRVCGRTVRVRQDSTVWSHKAPGSHVRCDGAGEKTLVVPGTEPDSPLQRSRVGRATGVPDFDQFVRRVLEAADEIGVVAFGLSALVVSGPNDERTLCASIAVEDSLSPLRSAGVRQALAGGLAREVARQIEADDRGLRELDPRVVALSRTRPFAKA